jgi:hypothetical protein
MPSMSVPASADDDSDPDHSKLAAALESPKHSAKRIRKEHGQQQDTGSSSSKDSEGVDGAGTGVRAGADGECENKAGRSNSGSFLCMK